MKIIYKLRGQNEEWINELILWKKVRIITTNQKILKNLSLSDSAGISNTLFYLIILFNLIIPTLLSLVGGTVSRNGCGSPNHL